MSPKPRQLWEHTARRDGMTPCRERVAFPRMSRPAGSVRPLAASLIVWRAAVGRPHKHDTRRPSASGGGRGVGRAFGPAEAFGEKVAATPQAPAPFEKPVRLPAPDGLRRPRSGHHGRARPARCRRPPEASDRSACAWIGHTLGAEADFVVAPQLAVVQAHELAVAAEYASSTPFPG